MGDPTELIVAFNRGTSEDQARASVQRCGAHTRRRMRTDHADQVTLLVRVDPSDADALKSALAGQVEYIEDNQSGYRAL